MNYFFIVFCIHVLQPKGVVTSGFCVRINTGAPLPVGADSVVQVEDTVLVKEEDDGRTEVEIKIMVAPKRGQDIRLGFLLIKL